MSKSLAIYDLLTSYKKLLLGSQKSSQNQKQKTSQITSWYGTVDGRNLAPVNICSCLPLFTMVLAPSQVFFVGRISEASTLYVTAIFNHGGEAKRSLGTSAETLSGRVVGGPELGRWMLVSVGPCNLQSPNGAMTKRAPGCLVPYYLTAPFCSRGFGLWVQRVPF